MAPLADKALAIGQTTPTPRTYPQCGGTVGLESFPGNHTILVNFDYDKDAFPVYINTDLGTLPGPCTDPKNYVELCGQTLSYPQLDTRTRAAGYSGPFDHSDAEVAAFKNASCPDPLPQPLVDAMNEAWNTKLGDGYRPVAVRLECGVVAPQGYRLLPANDSVVAVDYENGKGGETITSFRNMEEYPYLCGNPSAIPLALTCNGETIRPNNIREVLKLPAGSVTDEQAVAIYNSTKGCITPLTLTQALRMPLEDRLSIN
jgi:hypothetical protein